jgi:Lrp/AsnC family transcriptional regulator, leucine-responsive regulatory protein
MHVIFSRVPNKIRKKSPSAEIHSKLLDSIGWKILAELQGDARVPFAELGRRVGLSTPAVIERVHRLEEAGVIVGYRAHIDPAKVGYGILAYVRVNVVGDFLPRIVQLSREMPEVLECHRVTGTDSFIMKVAVPSIEALEELIDGLIPFVATTTAIVLSNVVTNRVIEQRRPRPTER